MRKQSVKRGAELVESALALAAIQGSAAKVLVGSSLALQAALSAPMFILESTNPIRRGVGGHLESR